MEVVLATLITILIVSVLLYYVYRGKSSANGELVAEKDVPGLKPNNAKDGNMAEIAKAGSLTEFLILLHKEYGPIATFWLKETQIVSIATPDLYRQVSHLFDRPATLFKSLEPVIGASSVQFRNGLIGQQTRKLHDRSFAHSKVVEKLPMFQQIGEEFCTQWEGLADSQQHIPLSTDILGLVMKALTRFALGDYFISDETVATFLKAYEYVFYIIEHFLVEGPLAPGSKEEESLQEEIGNLKKIVSEIIRKRQEAEVDPEEHIFIDTLLHEYDNEDMLFCDVITYFIGGSHTTSYYIFWTLYHLSRNQEMQDKVYNEICQCYTGGPITWEIMNSMTYLQSTMSETLRLTPLAPYAARQCDTDMTLGGYNVPSNTPILMSLHTTLWDEKLWPDPHTFNPDRFRNRTLIPAYNFEPFSFGKRRCPGFRLSEMESQIFLILILKQFKVSLAPGQKPVGYEYGIATKPDVEVYVTIERRG